MRKPVTEAYVFAQSPQGKLERAGHLQVSRTAGTFTYAENWLTRSWAYPLDPVNLKLHADTQTVRNTLRVFPVFSDAGPDDWGTRVLMAGHQQMNSNAYWLPTVMAWAVCNFHYPGRDPSSAKHYRPRHC